MMDHSRKNLSGLTVGRFAVQELCGVGAFGEVYRAYDTKMDRLVAMKRLFLDQGGDPRLRRRLQAEAQTVSAISHSNVAGVYDILEVDDEFLLVMEFVDGRTLGEIIRGGEAPLPVDRFLTIATQCVTALAAAQAGGVIHGDIKPENIMITAADEVKMCDFGVARRVQEIWDDRTLTGDGTQELNQLRGTPAYMAPEMFLRSETDARGDIFSLGVVFYELLAGCHPFYLAGDTLQSVRQRIIEKAPESILKSNRNVSPAIERLIFKMMSKDPADRYQTAADLLADLQAVQAAPRVRSRFVVALVATILAAIGIFSLRAPVSPDPHRPSVLITDFQNRTSDHFFDLTVRDLVTIGMGQSRFVNIYPRARIPDTLRRMQRAADSPIDMEVGREICLREGIQVLVTGDIALSDKGPVVSLRIVDPVTGQVKQVLTAPLSNKENLQASMGGLVTELRGALGETRLQINANNKPLAQVTTSSLRALELFSQAADLSHQRNRNSDVILLLKASLEADHNFAMALSYLAIAQAGERNLDEALASVTSAYNLRDRVSEREAFFIAGTYHAFRLEYEKAAESYQSLTFLYPDDVAGHDYLAQTYLLMHRYPEAVVELERVVKLNPNDVGRQRMLAGTLMYANKLDDAEKALAKVMAEYPDHVNAKWTETELRLARGNPLLSRKAGEELARVAQFENPARLHLTQVLFYEGKLKQASDELRDDVDRFSFRNDVIDLSRRQWLGEIGLILGRPAQTRVQADALSNRTFSTANLAQFRVAAGLYARIGDFQRAQVLLVAMKKLASESTSRFIRGASAYVEGEIALASGQTSVARERLQQARALWPDVLNTWTLANIYEKSGEQEKAFDTYRNLLDRKAEIFQWNPASIWVLSNLNAARMARHLGRPEEAASLYESFLRCWKESPEASGLVSEARQEFESLAINRSR